MAHDLDPTVAMRVELVAERYQLVRRIGAGGMAEVYEALDTRLGRRVAVKFPKAERLDDQRFLARLEKEANAIAALESEHCVSVLDVDTTAERPFIVMEYIRGESMRALIDREGCLPVPRAANIVQQAAVGLEAAHAAGIIHRDLKPENLMVSQVPYVGDWVKVLDFGIARVAASPAAATTTGSVLGTPHYMAPEQARGDADLDARVDVYALCSLLFELLTGERAHAGRSYNEVMYRVVSQPAPSLASLRPGVPVGLSKIIERGMAKDREQRIASSAALAAALEPYARSRRAETVDTEARTAAHRQVPERRPATGAKVYVVASLCALLALGAGGWAAVAAERAEAAPDEQRDRILPRAASPTPAPADVEPMQRASIGPVAPQASSSAVPPARPRSAPRKVTSKPIAPLPSAREHAAPPVLPVPDGFEANPYDE